MAAQIRVVRTRNLEEITTGDLLNDRSTGQGIAPSKELAKFSAKIGDDIASNRARAMDDESQLLDVEQLYPASQEINTRLSSGLGLIALSLIRLERALECYRGGDLIETDDQMSHLLVCLKDLFSVRDIGEGFSNIVSACISAIQNTAGEPFTEKQIVALNSALRNLRKKPFMTFETSLEIIDRLDGAGLDVDAQGVDAIQDWLVGNGVR